LRCGHGVQVYSSLQMKCDTLQQFQLQNRLSRFFDTCELGQQIRQKAVDYGLSLKMDKVEVKIRKAAKLESRVSY
jgi:hypothetical protein